MIFKIGLFSITALLICLKAICNIDVTWHMIFSPLWIGIPVIEIAKWVAWRLWRDFE